LLKNSKIP